jgi:hypothetical protein
VHNFAAPCSSKPVVRKLISKLCSTALLRLVAANQLWESLSANFANMQEQNY